MTGFPIPERDDEPARCHNGHVIGADGVCAHERQFRKAAEAAGRDPDDVRRTGW